MANTRADQYRLTLATLEQQKADYVNQINDLDGLIAGIAKQIHLIEGGAPVYRAPIDQPAMNRADRAPSFDGNAFKNMSVRWAILKLFGESPVGRSMSSSEIAKALETGGADTSGAVRFVGNVSAVVSGMKQKEEIEGAEEGRYRLTIRGKEAWDHIKNSGKYLDRLTPIAS